MFSSTFITLSILTLLAASPSYSVPHPSSMGIDFSNFQLLEPFIGQHDTQAGRNVPGAVYTMTNSASGNIVVSHDIGPDGKLSFAGATLTGGLGAHTNPGKPLTTDALESQNSLVVAGNRLYAVNAGSNTLSTFNINPNNPSQLTLLGDPVPSGGDFPKAVAVSPRSGQVCVLNGGKNNSIRCFEHVSSGLQIIPGTTIPLDFLGVRITSTPPTGPPESFSDMIFTPDGAYLLVSYKGTPPSNTTGQGHPGFIASFPITYGGGSPFVSLNTVKKTTANYGGALTYSMTFIPGTNALLNTDIAIGAVIYNYGKGFGQPATSGSAISIPGKKAVCWSGYSKRSGTYFVSDTATGVVSELQVDSRNLKGSVVRQYDVGGETTDLHIVGDLGGKDYLYVLAPATTQIAVFDTGSRPGSARIIQQFDFSIASNAFGAPVVEWNVQGMTGWVRR